MTPRQQTRLSARRALRLSGEYNRRGRDNRIKAAHAWIRAAYEQHAVKTPVDTGRADGRIAT